MSPLLSAAADLKRASFEVTTEGTLRTRSFAIGRSGFQRTVEAETGSAATTPASAAAGSVCPSPLPLASSPAVRAAVQQLDISDSALVEMGLLGRGAGGKVLKCLHAPSLTVVAVKCIDVSDRAKRAQLLKELKELADDGGSEHIVAFHGACYVDSTCTVKLGLEFMNRGSLQAVVHEHGRLSELALTHIVRQTLLGLQHLHSARKLHRDIKPGNILANHRGLAKLSDFGILAELSSSLAKCGTFVGTTIYMSPERLTSEAYGYPADVWSLGLTVLTLATGAFPLSTEDGYWGLVMHFNTRPSPSLPEGDEYSAAFRSFVSGCLAKEPAKRLTVRELLQHPWILNGCEAEEALTHWPKGARMHEPDPDVVRRQREDRLTRTRKWEEAEERKRRRQEAAAGRGGRPRQPQQQPAAADREQRDAGSGSGAAVARVAAASGAEGASEDEDGCGRVRHRRKAAITRFHPVGLLHLQAEASVQNSRAAAAAAGRAKSRLQRQEERKDSGDAMYDDGSGDEEEAVGQGRAAAAKAGTEETKEPFTSRSQHALSLLPAAAPVAPAATRPRALSHSRSAAGLPSPARPHRHNLRLVNGQLLQQLSLSPTASSAAPAFLPPSPSALAAVAPLSLPTLQQQQPTALSPSLPAAVAPARSLPALPAFSAAAAVAAAPSASSPAAVAPSSSSQVKRRAVKAAAGESAQLQQRERSSSSAAAAPSSPTPASPLLSAGLPAVHQRGTPSLHRRSPSVPAATAAPMSLTAAVPAAALPSAPAEQPQARDRAGSRPSQSSRALTRLPALQSADESRDDREEGDRTHRQLSPRPSLSASSPSLASAAAPSPLSPLQPQPSPARAAPPSSLSESPLSPRSLQVLPLIPRAEMDDLRTVLSAMMDSWRDAAAQPQQAASSRQQAGSISASPSPSSSSASALETALVSSDSSPASPLPVWLPGADSLQLSVGRVAEQLGIRASICLHELRALLRPHLT